ncbi:MAG TPA: MFS transporter [Syntrophorhabdales bacterium]|nr:MFS transporter [Syntrophorhabdales bacterium]
MKDIARSPWLILIIVLLSGIAATLNQFKVPPVMPLLMEAFSQSAGRAGLLMSIFALTGLLLAIPSGFILQKLGYRACGLTALAFLAIGAGCGTFSRGIGTMLSSRFIEGIGLGLIAVTGPEIIALWFAPEKRGRAMGIWSVWVPLGSMTMLILAPLLAVRWGWRAVWQFAWSYTIVVGLLFYFLVKARTGPSSDSGLAGRKTSRELSDSCRNLTMESLGRVLRNRNLWFVSLLFCCFNFVVVGFVTWAPTFLHSARDASIIRAAHAISLWSLMNIAAAPLAGLILDKEGSRKLICALPLLAMAFLLPAAGSAGEGLFLALTMAVGFHGGFVPAAVFAGAVEIAGDSRLAGMAVAVIQVGQNSGMFLGPFVFGRMVESSGWQAAFWVLGPVAVLGAVAALATDFSHGHPDVTCRL